MNNLEHLSRAELLKAVDDQEYCGNDIIQLYDRLKESKDGQGYYSYNPTGRNGLEAREVPILINPHYVLALQELLYQNAMFLGIIVEEDGDSFEPVQCMEMKMVAEGARHLLFAFEEEISGGC